MNTKQTAVKWLKTELEKYGSNSHLNLDWTTFDELIDQAKAMEEEQIKNAYDHMKCIGNFEYGEQYYNETFKSK